MIEKMHYSCAYRNYLIVENCLLSFFHFTILLFSTSTRFFSYLQILLLLYCTTCIISLFNTLHNILSMYWKPKSKVEPKFFTDFVEKNFCFSFSLLLSEFQYLHYSISKMRLKRKKNNLNQTGATLLNKFNLKMVKCTQFHT